MVGGKETLMFVGRRRLDARGYGRREMDTGNSVASVSDEVACSDVGWAGETADESGEPVV